MLNTQKFLPGIWLLTILLVSLPSSSVEPAKEQGMIARITANIFSKEHYRRHPLDDEISERLFAEYFRTLDPAKLYFTQEEIKSFEKYKRELDNQLLDGNISFAFEVYNLLLKKAEFCEKYTAELIKNGLDFTQDEEFVTDCSKKLWPVDDSDQKIQWRLKIKNDVLITRMFERAEMEEKEKSERQNDGKADEKKLGIWKMGSPEERVLKRVSNNLRYLKENDSIEILELYLTSLANIYDPHSGYMSPKTVEDFNIQMRLSLVGIGATLSIEDGYTKIVNIIPGGPADLDGRLKPEDRIIAVAQKDQDPVDVIDMPLSKVVGMIRGKKDTEVELTALKADKGYHSVPEIISIRRDTVKLTEQGVKGEIRRIKNENGTGRKIGVISIPSFYFDFAGAASGDDNFRSSTADVKKFLDDFSREAIDGLVLDLRSNGGGSLIEAITLTGLFIKEGPVVQVKIPSGSVEIKYDPDEDICYDGPIAVLVNRLSASAAEIFAGAIQDYGRGIVVGDNSTHGKGTVQTILDLDSQLRYWGFKQPSGSVRITTAKFYRVNGESTQNKGVIPDIVFPSFTDEMEIGEQYMEHALPWDSISAVKHDNFYDIQKYISELSAISLKRRNEDAGFKILTANIRQYKKIKEMKSITLNEEKRWAFYKEEKKIFDQQYALIKLEEAPKEDKNNGKKQKDIYMEETVRILGDLVNLSSKPENLRAEVKNRHDQPD